MVSRILIPDQIKEEIREYGIRERKRHREACGLLVGPFEDDDSISIQYRYTLPSKFGIGKPLFLLSDFLYTTVHLPLIWHSYMQSRQSRERIVGNGNRPATLYYHTHRQLEWSDADLFAHQKLIGNYREYLAASVLYIVGKDEFLAMDDHHTHISIV